uniref:Uncharacterized protein n=1 Tax=Oryza rufipogon TaxID=4529 RepID=A0A0E0Q0W6_ORYRU
MAWQIFLFPFFFLPIFSLIPHLTWLVSVRAPEGMRGRSGVGVLGRRRAGGEERRTDAAWREERSRDSGTAGRAQARQRELDGDNGHVGATAARVVGAKRPSRGRGVADRGCACGGRCRRARHERGGCELDSGSGGIGRAQARQRELDGDNGHVELRVAEDDELKLSPFSIGKLELSLPSPHNDRGAATATRAADPLLPGANKLLTITDVLLASQSLLSSGHADPLVVPYPCHRHCASPPAAAHALACKK